ncbi:hypothetical protein [Nonomuraea turkmeniaca]|uniref:hypothetical protein n=1 Tax=Nonomuraea turkmeniaca TaxID=103838 RepID=UPI0014775C31|nr:hypothetical protein [Nonomuraea turkmeniaca]
MDALTAAANERAHDPAPAEQVRLKLAECDRRLKSYKDTLDAGANPAVVSAWIQQTQAERTAALATLRRTDKKPKMTRDQIARTIEKLEDMVTAFSEGSPTRKADLYKSLGLRAEFDPETRKVRASVEVAPHGDLVGVRGGTHSIRTCRSRLPPGSFFLVGRAERWIPVFARCATSSVRPSRASRYWP